MNFAREAWVKYHKTRTGRENRLAFQGELLYPMMLKLAAPEHGVIPLRVGGGAPERQLFNFIGGRRGVDDRLIATGLRDMVGAGFLDVAEPGITLVGWAKAQSKREGSRDPWPFFRLYVRETGSFAELSYGARAIAAQVLRVVGDDGRMYLGKNVHYSEMIVRQRGWHVEGRWARRSGLIDGWLEELVADGYLVRGTDTERGVFLGIRNYMRAQVIGEEEEALRRPPRPSRAPRPQAPAAPPPHADNWAVEAPEVAPQRSDSGATAAWQRSDSGVIAERQRSEVGVKQAELFTSALADRSDPSLVDSIRSHTAVEATAAGSEKGGDQAVSAPVSAPSEPARTDHAVPAKPSGRAVYEYGADFERTWTEYPTREGTRGNKYEAQSLFLAAAKREGMTTAAFADLLIADIVQRKRLEPSWRNGKPVDMTRYLGKRGWLTPLPIDALAARLEREERARREMAEREARELPHAERVERVAMAETDWRGPDKAEVWRRPYARGLHPDSQVVWDRVYRQRLRELGEVRYQRQDLPLWAREFLDAHPRAPRADGSGWTPKASATDPVPIRPGAPGDPPTPGVAAAQAVFNLVAGLDARLGGDRRETR